MHAPPGLAAAILALLLSTAPARAGEPPPSPTPARRAAAIGASLVPGLLVHGAGSYVLGERRAAHRLGLAQLASLGVIVVAGAPLALTYGSRRVAPWTIPVVVSGSSVLLTTWIADVWVAAGGPNIAGRPWARAPWQIDLGATWADAPPLSERAFTRLAAAWQPGRLRLAPSALIAVDGDAQRFALDVAWQLAGEAASSFVEARAALAGERRGNDGFSNATVEAAAHGRLDLAAVAPVLAGSYAYLTAGFGFEVTRYRGGAVDVLDLLLGRFGFGAYLGSRAEVAVWYDHRRDDLAGGLAASRAAGFLGSFGTTAEIVVIGPWSVVTELQVGSAWVATAAVRLRGGAR